MRVLLPFIRLMKSHIGWVLVGTLLGLVTLLASIGLLTLSGWFIAATAMAGVSMASAQAFNYLTPGGAVRGLAIARTAGRYFERVTTHEATFRLLAELRCWFYSHLEPLNPARLRHYRSADLLNRMITDINSLDNLYLRVVSPTLIALGVGCLVSGFLGWIHPSLGLLLLSALILAGVVIPWIGHRLGSPLGVDQVAHASTLRQSTLTFLQGMTELHLYQSLVAQQDYLNERQRSLQRLQLRMSLISGFVTALMSFAAGLTTLLALILGISLVNQGILAPAWLALVVFCVLASFEAIAPLPLAYQYLGKTRASATNLLEITQQRSDINFPEESVVEIRKGEVEFQSVRFSYDDRVILPGLSFKVSAGEKVVVTGHTGSGKSSIINLLSRFWTYQQGTILLGGAPLEAYSENQLRHTLSILSQPVQLFAGSVRSNLKLADENLTDTQMLAMLEALDLTDMLGNDGLDREVGEGGNRLSGGQRKRLGIARALLKQSAIVILDEPTEGLDFVTAQRVLNTVFEFTTDKTLILITHHGYQLDRFDQHIKLDQGQRIH